MNRKLIKMAGGVAGVALLGLGTVAVAGDRMDASRYVAAVEEHVETSAAGYDLLVHPGFSRGATLHGAEGSVELYRQQETFNLPAGRTAGPEEHVIRLRGGELGRDIGLVVTDPKHQIARITVELYGSDYVPGSERAVTEVLEIENWSKVCPPECSSGVDEGSPGGGA
jgi:hypothetical protein